MQFFLQLQVNVKDKKIKYQTWILMMISLIKYDKAEKEEQFFNIFQMDYGLELESKSLLKIHFLYTK